MTTPHVSSPAGYVIVLFNRKSLGRVSIKVAKSVLTTLLSDDRSLQHLHLIYNNNHTF